MNEHRRQILQMLAEWKITADEAERLISAMEQPSARPQDSDSTSAAKSRAKYLRVQVDSEDDGEARGPHQGQCARPHATASRWSQASRPDSAAGLASCQ